jgi:hypothetical protein
MLNAHTGNWERETLTMMGCTLRVRGFGTNKGKGDTSSPFDMAMETIRRFRRVHGALPRLYHPDHTFEQDGEHYLNIAKAKVMPSAPVAGAWGENFPKLAAIFDHVFDNGYGVYFHAWLKRFYESAEQGRLLPGQAMALVGPVQCYKSFLIQKVVRPMMGGSCDLSSVAQGSQFTDSLFDSPVAVLDDSRGSSTPAERARYTATIKGLVSKGSHDYQAKYGKKLKVQWNGRVIMGLNNDPTSILVIPDLDQSNDDKVIALHMKQWPDHPAPEVYNDIETEEVPHYIAWLKEYQPPGDVLDPSDRYVVKSFICPEVRHYLFEASAANDLLSVLEVWWAARKSNGHPEPFKGTCAELLSDITEMLPNTPAFLRGMTPRTLGYRLRELSNSLEGAVKVSRRKNSHKGSNRYVIDLSMLETDTE